MAAHGDDWRGLSAEVGHGVRRHDARSIAWAAARWTWDGWCYRAKDAPPPRKREVAAVPTGKMSPNVADAADKLKDGGYLFRPYYSGKWTHSRATMTRPGSNRESDKYDWYCTWRTVTALVKRGIVQRRGDFAWPVGEPPPWSEEEE